MTLADVAPPAHEPVPAVPTRRRGRRLAVGVSLVLLLWAGGATAVTYYHDSVPLVENNLSYPVVPVAELPPPVANAFVAAVDPDFYASDDSLITRRYTVIASGADEESGWRTRVLADKAEHSYTKTDILDRYLNRARLVEPGRTEQAHLPRLKGACGFSGSGRPCRVGRGSTPDRRPRRCVSP